MAEEFLQNLIRAAAAASAAAPPARGAQRARADHRPIGRLDAFDGSPEHWAEWSFKARAYLHLQAGMPADHLEAAARSSTPAAVPDDVDEPVLHEANVTLYYVLVTCCRGAAATLLRKAPAAHGLEAWRLLSRKFDPADDRSSLGLLTTVLRFNFGDSLDTLGVKLDQFDVLVAKYEAGTVGGETVADGIKRALLISGLPEPLSTHARVNGPALDTYDKLRAMVDEYLLSKRLWSPDLVVPGANLSNEQGPVPMDIGHVKGGKGKGGKGKGRGNKGGLEGYGKGSSSGGRHDSGGAR